MGAARDRWRWIAQADALRTAHAAARWRSRQEGRKFRCSPAFLRGRSSRGIDLPKECAANTQHRSIAQI
jgi:hypothetical protein